MSSMFTTGALPSCSRGFVMACVFVAVFTFGERPASAQGRDGLLNGAAIGAAVGGGVGVAFTHAVRDSDLGFGQYAYGALVFGAIGAGVGVGIDALLNRAAPIPPINRRKVWISPIVRRSGTGVVMGWRW